MAIVKAQRSKEEAVEKAKHDKILEMRRQGAAAKEERMKTQTELVNIAAEQKKLMEEEAELERELQSVIEAGGDRADVQRLLELFKDKKLKAEFDAKKREAVLANKQKAADEAAELVRKELEKKNMAADLIDRERMEKESEIRRAEAERLVRHTHIHSNTLTSTL